MCIIMPVPKQKRIPIFAQIMEPFTVREGFVSPETQPEKGISDGLSNCLWNAFYSTYLIVYDASGQELPWHYSRYAPWYSPRETMFKKMWLDFFEQRQNEIPGYPELWLQVFDRGYQILDGFKKFDFVEAVWEYGPPEYRDSFGARCDECLLKGRTPYRFVEGRFAPYMTDAEKRTVQDAIASTEITGGPESHLKKALDHISSRERPDYRSSMQNSISALESAVKEAAGTDTTDKNFGTALAILKEKVSLENSLRDSISKLFGWTNEIGVRHGSPGKRDLKKEDALYLLVTCSALVNYINYLSALSCRPSRFPSIRLLRGRKSNNNV